MCFFHITLASSRYADWNMMDCDRVRPPAARLAASNQIIDEQAWFTDAATGRVALKTGPSDFSFGERHSLLIAVRRERFD